MRKLFIFLLLLLSVCCFSQSKYEVAKFNIIRQAILLYSTDLISFPSQSKSELSCKQLNYNCLQSYCTDNNLTNVWSNVSGWKEKFPANSKDDLKYIRDTIRNALLNPGKKEAADFRKNKIGMFDKYADSVIDMISDNGPTPVPLSAAVAEKEDSLVKKDVVTNSKNESSLLPLIALVVAIISLAGVIIVASRLMTKVSDSNKRITKRKDEIDDLKNKMLQSTPDTPVSSSRAMKPFEDKIKILEERIVALERRLKTASTEEPPKINLPKETKEAVVITTKKKTAESQPANKLMYAKMPDVNNGSGFNDAMLSSSQNGEQIYEIEVKGNVATFIITNDAKAQKYALSDYMRYLSEACEFINQPSPNCRIYTKDYGTLARRGNDWLINEKARIEFV